MSTKDRYGSTGYTLIELLIVVFIISIVTSVALLSINHNKKRKLAAVANELVQAITLAEEQAMLQPVVLGMRFKSYSYQFLSYEPAIDMQGAHWSHFQDNILKGGAFPKEIQLSVETETETPANQDKENGVSTPQIVISNNGDLTPFKIFIGEVGKAPRYVIRGEADGNVHLEG